MEMRQWSILLATDEKTLTQKAQRMPETGKLKSALLYSCGPSCIQ